MSNEKITFNLAEAEYLYFEKKMVSTKRSQIFMDLKLIRVC